MHVKELSRRFAMIDGPAENVVEQAAASEAKAKRKARAERPAKRAAAAEVEADPFSALPVKTIAWPARAA
jgi:hypothetical protein